MAACTFFGHSECPSSIRPEIRSVLVDLIENYAVDTFYVGRQGSFDAMVSTVLRELSTVYTHIRYAVVLERFPDKRDLLNQRDFSDTILPEGVECVHPRFAVSWRNNWMLKQSDYVVTYITHSWGGAAQFAEKAARQKKTVINIAAYP